MPRTNAINQCSRKYAKWESGEEKSKKEALRDLGPREAKRFYEKWVKNRKTIENDPNHKKKIQKSCQNNPPAVIDFF
jgi:hypothetical protein